jgi:hypothetical protein
MKGKTRYYCILTTVALIIVAIVLVLGKLFFVLKDFINGLTG